MTGGIVWETRRPGRRRRRAAGRVLVAGIVPPAMALAALATPPWAGDAGAQELDVIPGPTLVVEGGLSHRLDFFGEGSSPLFGLRFRLPLGDHVLIQPGTRYTSFPPDTAGRSNDAEDVELLIVDFQAQFQLRFDRFRPYVGVGAGGAVDFRDERGNDDFLVSVFSAGGGVAFDAAPGIILLGEVRYRTLDELDHRVVETTLGVGWRP